MTKEQCVPGTRVRYTGDSDNFGESWTIPRRNNILGTVERQTNEYDNYLLWDVLVRWDEPITDAGCSYYYKAASLSPAITAGF